MWETELAHEHGRHGVRQGVIKINMYLLGFLEKIQNTHIARVIFDLTIEIEPAKGEHHVISLQNLQPQISAMRIKSSGTLSNGS